MTNIQSVNVVTEMKSAYGDYAMAVLLGRAIPNLYDGLKPVTRRILTAMRNLNLRPEGRYMKSARIEGETMGKFHPHGGAYGAMVTAAAPYSNNHPLIDGWGNWGSSVDGAAASRYTECKLSAFSWDCMLQGKDTWVTQDNYDGSLQEPVYFNAAIPYVLVNGQTGIGVGFATHILPHNLRGIARAIALLPKLDTGDGEEVMAEMREHLVPDFPTGCDIVRDENLSKYLSTGAGSVRCRAKAEIGRQEREGRAKNRWTVTFTNLPPNLNPEKLGEQIKKAVDAEKISEVAEVIDESDRTGDRVLVVGRPNANAEQLRDELYFYTDLDTRISAKTLVIDGTKPVELSPSQVIERWLDWRMERLSVQFSFERDRKNERLHVVEGLLSALDQLDEVIAAIRASRNKEAARKALCSEPFGFTEAQADAILEMRLRQLTGLDKRDLQKEARELKARIKELASLIKDDNKRQTYLLEEVEGLAERHGNKRRSGLCEPLEGPSPAALVGAPAPRAQAPLRPAQPRMVKVAPKTGIVTQVKGPRGAILLQPSEKLIVVTTDTVYKVPHKFKGPVNPNGSVEVLLAKGERYAQDRNYLTVFTLGEEVRYMTLEGAKLVRATSKGKRLLPEGATLLSFGESSWEIPWSGNRKKLKKLQANDAKTSAPGAKGIKLCPINQLSLQEV